MNEQLPPIYFYLPECEKLKDKIPESADIYLPNLYRDGVYCWTMQTYLRLKADGFPCELTGTMPKEGIVLVHRSSIPINLRPESKVLVICLMADKERHPYAPLHVVLNTQDKILKESQTLWESYYIPHWPQPGLIPRNTARGERFENIAYFGHERNLAPELQESGWQEQLKDLGLSFQVVERQHWHDFSHVDAILAVRSFKHQAYNDKPATKLYNSWHAGVPAILGSESAFQAEYQNELDYTEVTSPQEVVKALQHLRDDQEFRHAMVENGKVRAKATEPAKLVDRWRGFLTEKAVPAYYRWCKMTPWQQQIFFLRRYLSFKKMHMENRWRGLVSRG